MYCYLFKKRPVTFGVQDVNIYAFHDTVVKFNKNFQRYLIISSSSFFLLDEYDLLSVTVVQFFELEDYNLINFALF